MIEVRWLYAGLLLSGGWFMLSAAIRQRRIQLSERDAPVLPPAEHRLARVVFWVLGTLLLSAYCASC